MKAKFSRMLRLSVAMLVVCCMLVGFVPSGVFASEGNEIRPAEAPVGGTETAPSPLSDDPGTAEVAENLLTALKLWLKNGPIGAVDGATRTDVACKVKYFAANGNYTDEVIAESKGQCPTTELVTDASAADLISYQMSGNGILYEFVNIAYQLAAKSDKYTDPDWSKLSAVDAETESKFREIYALILDYIAADGALPSAVTEGSHPATRSSGNSLEWIREMIYSNLGDTVPEEYMPYIDNLAYLVAEYILQTLEAIEELKAASPDAQILLVGMYNPIDGATVTMEGNKIDLGELFDYFVSIFDFATFFYAMVDEDITYVSAADAAVDSIGNLDVDALLAALDSDSLDEILSESAKFNNWRTAVKTNAANANGRAYIAKQIFQALNANHHWNEGVITTQPGCTADGVKTFTCSVCGETKTEPVAANGHTYTDVVTAPTCTAKGCTTHTCSVCGYTYADSFVDALGHTYTEVVTAPTCTAKGYTTHTCSVCGDTYVDSYVDALPHTYTAVVTAPTCTAQGYTTHTCTGCGDVYLDTFVPATGHSYSGGVCVNCGEEDPNYNPPSAGPFSDVFERDWFYNDVMAVYNAGYLNGYPDGTFRPNNALTRAEAATILYRLSGSPEVKGTASFPDLPNEWYQTAIAWAEQNGVVKGFPDGTFRPDEGVTREQFVTMVWRLAGAPASTTPLTDFEDADSISDYAKEAFSWGIDMAIISGIPSKEWEGLHLAPQTDITRCQVAKILSMYISLFS